MSELRDVHDQLVTISAERVLIAARFRELVREQFALWLETRGEQGMSVAMIAAEVGVSRQWIHPMVESVR